MMKRISILCLALSLCGAVSAGTAWRHAGRDDSVDAFWQKFSAAVIRGDREAVATLSRFPIGMSYGIPSIRNRSQLRRRYREVFNRQADAPRCFGKAKPEMDAANPKQFTVACPDAAGNEVVIYHFTLTKAGWRFTELDNINE